MVWVAQQEEREDVAQPRAALQAVEESRADLVLLAASAALLGGVEALAAEVHLRTLFNKTF